jgi:hypothetical protein
MKIDRIAGMQFYDVDPVDASKRLILISGTAIAASGIYI